MHITPSLNPQQGSWGEYVPSYLTHPVLFLQNNNKQ